MRRTFTAVVERDMDTGYYIGFVPGFPGAHTQAETLDELNANLKESSKCCSKAATSMSRRSSSGRN